MRAKALVSHLFVLVAAAGCSKSEAPPPAAAQPAASTPAAGSGTTGIVAPTPPPAAAPAAAAAPTGAAAIATADGETSGVRLEVTELKRASGGTVNLKFTIINETAERISFNYNYADKDHEVIDFNSVGGVHLIDPVGKRKYFVARDSEKKCVCSQQLADIHPGKRTNLWAKFPAPPDDVQKISIVVPHFPPMDDVTLSR